MKILGRTVRLAKELIRRQSSVNVLDQKIIDAALQARKDMGCDRAEYGDCRDASERTVTLLEGMGIPARLAGGQFTTNFAEGEEWDHSWVVVGDEILDPTVDQFFSPLEVDLETVVSGIYYSPVDGGWLDDRYRGSR